MFILKEVYKQIENTIGQLKPECGGIIAMDKDGIISDFYFDDDAGFGKRSYIPTRSKIQYHIQKNWNSESLQFCGVVHSHPLCNICEPSYIDISMAWKIMTINNMEKFYLLMVKGSEVRIFFITNENNNDQAPCKEEKLEIK